MFTGLVEGLGRIERVVDENSGRRLTLIWPDLPAVEPLVLGESIAVNGCCLTVTAASGPQFQVQAGPETLARTNLGEKRPGDRVNLERALKVGDRLGGHFVRGHIETTAPILRDKRHREKVGVHSPFGIDPSWGPLLVKKGSIAVDGVSLTLVDLWPDAFSVMLIPHTLAMTTLGGACPQRPHQHRDRHPGQARPKTAGKMNAAPPPNPVVPSQLYCARRGISPQRRLGQNFLIDLNIHELIVKTAEVGAGDVILEVGSGTGALTSLMAGTGAKVVAVDVDPAMARLTAESTGRRFGLASRVLYLRRLGQPSTRYAHSEILDNVRSGLAAGKGERFKLVANLPYHVATPVITNLLIHAEFCPVLMVVTIQRELADRLCAIAASPPYGALSVVVQALAEVSLVRSLPPSVFWPRPKVDSAVIAIRPDPVKRAAVGDVPFFHGLVRRVFMHRRKYLRHALAGIWRDEWDKSEVDTWLESRGLRGQIRAEVLDIEEFVALSHALRERFGELPGPGSGSAQDRESTPDEGSEE